MIKPTTYSLSVALAAAMGTLPLSGAHATSQPQQDFVSPFLYTSPTNSTPTDQYSDFGLQGIKGGDTAGTYLITGTTNYNGVTHGAVYSGPINHGFSGYGSGTGTWTIMDVPVSNSTGTSVYGVDNLGNGTVNLVGSYIDTTNNQRVGFYYAGPLTSSPSSSSFIYYSGQNQAGKTATFTYIHSVSGGLAVGNYDFLGDGNPAGNAFIFAPYATQQQINIIYPDTDKTHTAYGIWYNGGTSYTIAGGVGLSSATIDNGYGEPLGQAYLIDYDSSQTGEAAFSNYQTFSYKASGALKKRFKHKTLVTHFEGIWTNGNGLYKMPATVTALDDTTLAVGVTAQVRRNKASGKFAKKATWTPINVPNGGFWTSDSIYDTASVGLVTYPAANGAPSFMSDYAVIPVQTQ